MSFYLPYLAIGNQDTPPEIVRQLADIAGRLKDAGYTARTTGKGAADEGVMITAGDKCEVHIPWKKFDGIDSKFNKVLPEALEMVKQYHGAFDSQKDSIKTIIGRGAHLVLGQDLRSPVRFVVCWSQDGLENAKDRSAKSGYIGIPVSIASSMKIPVFNLKNPDALRRLNEFLDL